VHPDCADGHNRAALASTLDRQLHRLAGGSRRRDEHGIGAIPPSEALHFENGIVIADSAPVTSQCQGQLEVAWGDVYTNHAATTGLQQLHGQQADQP
jgi:hypothetical protein